MVRFGQEYQNYAFIEIDDVFKNEFLKIFFDRRKGCIISMDVALNKEFPFWAKRYLHQTPDNNLNDYHFKFFELCEDLRLYDEYQQKFTMRGQILISRAEIEASASILELFASIKIPAFKRFAVLYRTAENIELIIRHTSETEQYLLNRAFVYWFTGIVKNGIKELDVDKYLLENFWQKKEEIVSRAWEIINSPDVEVYIHEKFMNTDMMIYYFIYSRLRPLY
jgi:hypothetical protein